MFDNRLFLIWILDTFKVTEMETYGKIRCNVKKLRRVLDLHKSFPLIDHIFVR